MVRRAGGASVSPGPQLGASPPAPYDWQTDEPEPWRCPWCTWTGWDVTVYRLADGINTGIEPPPDAGETRHCTRCGAWSPG